jgi:hypothetical protein
MKVYPIPSGIANPQRGSNPKGGGKLFWGKGGAIWVRFSGRWLVRKHVKLLKGT